MTCICGAMLVKMLHWVQEQKRCKNLIIVFIYNLTRVKKTSVFDIHIELVMVN